MAAPLGAVLLGVLALATPALEVEQSRAARRLSLDVPALSTSEAPRFEPYPLDQGGGGRGVESPWVAAAMSGVIGFGAGHVMVGARSDALMWLGIDAGATLTGILIGVIADHGAVWGVVAVGLVGGRVVEALDAFSKGEHIDPGDPMSGTSLRDEQGRRRTSVEDGDAHVNDLDDERTRREAEAAEEEEAPSRRGKRPKEEPKPKPAEDEEERPAEDEDDRRLDEGALPTPPGPRPA